MQVRGKGREGEKTGKGLTLEELAMSETLGNHKVLELERSKSGMLHLDGETEIPRMKGLAEGLISNVWQSQR